MLLGQCRERLLPTQWYGDQRPPGRLGEQRDERFQPLGQRDDDTDSVPQRCLDQRLRQPAVGQVVCGTEVAAFRGGHQYRGK